MSWPYSDKTQTETFSKYLHVLIQTSAKKTGKNCEIKDEFYLFLVQFNELLSQFLLGMT